MITMVTIEQHLKNIITAEGNCSNIFRRTCSDCPIDDKCNMAHAVAPDVKLLNKEILKDAIIYAIENKFLTDEDLFDITL